MWIFILLSLALYHGTLAEIDCSKTPDDNCEKPDLFSFFPRDELEYSTSCPQLPAYIRCMKEVQGQCGQGSSPFFACEEEYEGMYSAFSEACEEGSFLHRVATVNIRCFNETLHTLSCPEKARAVIQPYRNIIDDTYPIEIICLVEIMEVDCIAAELGKNCGQKALEATLELFRRTYLISEVCDKNSAEYLLKNMDEYNLDEKQRVAVTAALEKVIISAKK